MGLPCAAGGAAGPGLPVDCVVTAHCGAIPPIERPRVQRITLRELAEAPLTAEEVVVLPPAVTLQSNRAMLARLQALDTRGQEVAAA